LPALARPEPLAPLQLPQRLPLPATLPAPATADPLPAEPPPAPQAAPSEAVPPAATPGATTKEPAQAPPSPGDAPASPSGSPTPSRDAAVGLDGAPIPAATPGPPRLNLELPRAGAEPGVPARGLLPVLPAPPQRRSKLAEDIDKAAKKDCRTAYSGMGLLAVVPLARDSVKDNGCRW
jgi:hypothetical protein